jgi:O-antigen/teichoic acid export membrane protein
MEPTKARPLVEDPVVLADAGLRSIRGGVIRVVGYVMGSALAAAASVLLLRYLGVAEFGRYITVMSLIGIVTGFTDLGLTLIGQREYVLRDTEGGRRDLVGNILGIRLVATPIGVALAVAFAIGAGYGRTLVLGTVVVGCSLILGNAALALVVPLTAALRFGAVTASDVARQLVTVCGNAVLVAAGAGLLAFFGVHVAAALAALALAVVFLGRRPVVLPRFSLPEWRIILREAAPMGAALVVAALYLRTLVIMSSLLTSEYQTGLFATAYRILEILVAIPALMVGSAFPIMARSGLADEARLRNVLQQLLEASMLLALLLVIVLVIAAGPIVRILGGSEYSPAAPVLRIESIALLGSFASVIWTTGLIAVRRQAALIIINVSALVSVLVLGGMLIPVAGAKGAAAAAAGGEALLALTALVMLVRERPTLRPSFRFVPRLLPAAAAAGLCGLIPGVPALGNAVIAGVVYAGATFVAGAVPREAKRALMSWRQRAA